MSDTSKDLKRKTNKHYELSYGEIMGCFIVLCVITCLAYLGISLGVINILTKTVFGFGMLGMLLSGGQIIYHHIKNKRVMCSMTDPLKRRSKYAGTAWGLFGWFWEWKK